MARPVEEQRSAGQGYLLQGHFPVELPLGHKEHNTQDP